MFCVPFSLSKWCGDAEDQEMSLSERLVDFVGHSFRNRAYMALSRSTICVRGEFCDQEHEVITTSFRQFCCWFYGWVVLHGWVDLGCALPHIVS